MILSLHKKQISKDIEIVSLISSDEEVSDVQLTSKKLPSNISYSHRVNGQYPDLQLGDKRSIHIYVANKNVKIHYIESTNELDLKPEQLNDISINQDSGNFLLSGNHLNLSFSKLIKRNSETDILVVKESRSKTPDEFNESAQSSYMTANNSNMNPVDQSKMKQNRGIECATSEDQLLNDSQSNDEDNKDINISSPPALKFFEDAEPVIENNILEEESAKSSEETSENSKLFLLNSQGDEQWDVDHNDDDEQVDDVDEQVDDVDEQVDDVDEQVDDVDEQVDDVDEQVDDDDDEQVDDVSYNSVDLNNSNDLDNELEQLEGIRVENNKSNEEHSDDTEKYNSQSDDLPSPSSNESIQKNDSMPLSFNNLVKNDGDKKFENDESPSKSSLASEQQSSVDDDFKDDLFVFASDNEEIYDVKISKEEDHTIKDEIVSSGTKRKLHAQSDGDDDISDILADDINEENEGNAKKTIESFFSDETEELYKQVDLKVSHDNAPATKISPSLPLFSQHAEAFKIVKRQRTSLSSIIGDRDQTRSKSPEPIERKVRVSIISQLTGFENCILVIEVKQKKPLKSILPKAIDAIIKQNQSMTSNFKFDEHNCSFYHNKIKLSPHNTISDVKRIPGEPLIELMIVSNDKAAELFETDYKLLQTMKQQEEKMKIMDYNLKLGGVSNKEEAWAKKLSNLKEEQIEAEVSDVESSVSDSADGFFNIKLLDKSNKPIIVKVRSEMTINDVFSLYKEQKEVDAFEKVIIIFDGDIVDLTETLEHLGLEEDDMLEFVIK
ncbi:hypothetical protein QEN19_002380 [Hanseniaspora menglaensis]